MAVLATAIWRVRPSGNNTNGGGYDPGIAGAATDYSRQNAAQATGTNGATTGTTNFADTTANAFTAAMIGNAIYITGTGQTTGFYFVTGFVDVGNVTLDRSPGTGTGATWNLGGGWADFWTNAAIPIFGNVVYILGSGVPNPASYVYDYTMPSYCTPAAGVYFINDSSTPNYKTPPDTTGGMPVIKVPGLAFYNSGWMFAGLWFVELSTQALGALIYGNGINILLGCVLDQAGYDMGLIRGNYSNCFGCEVFSSVVPGAPGSIYAIGGPSGGAVGLSSIMNCNIHDTVGPGCLIVNSCKIISCIISKCRGVGIEIVSVSQNQNILNNTIDGNTGHGILTADFSNASNNLTILNNIISNHTGVGKYGLILTSALAPTNALFACSNEAYIDYNVYYNNTADISSPLTYGIHDTHGGSDPYVAQSTENYTLK